MIGAHEARRPRRIVMCLDGTWNFTYMRKRRDDGTQVVKPSNVLKLARAVEPTAPDGREQLVYYDIGVGSLATYPGVTNRLLALTDKLLGGSSGAGFEGNVEDALGFLALNYLPEDEVFVFGFSRGAATARAVAQFLDWAGGLPTKSDAYYVPHLFRAYVVSRGERRCQEVVAAIDAGRAQERIPRDPLKPFTAVDVALVGVWDTVMALGSRLRALGGRTSGPGQSFHVGEWPPACVRHARQALALDERRYDFRPEIWTGHTESQTLRQRWFAGVHSNVGGGYVHDGLANLAFRWMLKEAQTLGLAVDSKFAAHYGGYAQDALYDSYSLGYRWLDRIRCRAGRGKRTLIGWPEAANLTLDPSVIVRVQADPADHPRLREVYRPSNVMQLLAAQDDLDQFMARLGAKDPSLPGDVVAALRTLGEADAETSHFRRASNSAKEP